MPGGSPEAWPHLKDIFQSIAAKSDNEACCDWLGEAGSGHFVKMVHNGIEYGDMQLIAEAYDLLLNGLGLSQDEMANVFDEWNKGELDSFLIEITANILRYKDESGESVVPKILDSAGQKGTGKWTGISALEYGQPVTLIAEAVFARCLSALKEQRVLASKVLPGSPLPQPEAFKNKKDFIFKLGQALYASKIVSYAQGFMLLGEASRESWRVVVASAALSGIPTPAFSSALAFYDGYRRPVGPANLLQAQRDYFGAHTYKLLTDAETSVHTNWTGRGGRVTSNAYQA
uniref:Phosphogluconate dehydrogenase (NADP(+)-dependent, decarboxylating) n=1 Tax=Panagrolaimus sp. ES5 TaxID=591445 RepID=A0AC34GAU2_9BILA